MYLFIYMQQRYTEYDVRWNAFICAFMFVCRYVIMHVYVLYFCNHSCEDIQYVLVRVYSISYILYVLLGAHARHVSMYSYMHTGIYLYTGICVHFLMHEFMLMGMHSCMRRQVCIKTGRHVSMLVIAHECNRQCILKCTHFCLQKYLTIFLRMIFLLMLDHQNFNGQCYLHMKKTVG
jgi:hypothetical protein